eukprot:gene10071-20988_t
MSNRYVKALYIEAGVDSKASATLLENAVRSRGLLVSFTVVSNAILGIETTEHNAYDIAFVEDCLDGFGAADFVGLLRTMGNPVPVVLLVDIDDAINDDHIRSLGFSGVLRKPFAASSLHQVLQSILNQNPKLNEIFPSSFSELSPPTRYSISPSSLPYEKGLTTYEGLHTKRPAPSDEWDDELEATLLIDEHLGDVKIFPQYQGPSDSIYEFNAPGVKFDVAELSRYVFF